MIRWFHFAALILCLAVSVRAQSIFHVPRVLATADTSTGIVLSATAPTDSLERFEFFLAGVPGSQSPNLILTPTVVDVLVTSPVAVGGYQAEFTFDPTVVQLSGAGVTGGDPPFNSTPIVVNIDNTAGTVTLNDFKMSPAAAGTAVVARLRFEAKAAGTSVLKITKAGVVNTSGGDVSSATMAFSTNEVRVR